jgi:hypothetical protein
MRRGGAVCHFLSAPGRQLTCPAHAGDRGDLPPLTPRHGTRSGVRPASYGIRGGSTSLKVRRALLFYALRRLGLDVAADVRPANEQHIVLVNRAEVEAARVQAPQA